MHLYTEYVLKIEKYDDIDKAIYHILNNIDTNVNVDFKQIEPLELKFKGKRFDAEYLPVEFFDILKTFEIEYTNFYSEVINKDIKNNKLHVKVQRGCLQDLFEGKIPTEVVTNLLTQMNSTQTLIIILFSIGCWFGSKSIKNYVDAQTKRLEVSENNTMTKESLSLAKEALNFIRNNQKLEKAKNRPIAQSLRLLEQNENLDFGIINKTQSYNRNDDINFPYINIDDKKEKYTYDTIIETYFIKGINEKKKKDKILIKSNNRKSFEATMMLSQNEIHAIYKAKENKEEIMLKLKIGTNIKKDIKEATVIEIMK